MSASDNHLITELEWQLDSMSRNRLLALRDKIDGLLQQNRPEPRWPGGETLWHKHLKTRVRAIYEEAEENYAVRVHWSLERGEWIYQDKYTGDEMFESDLEPWTLEKEQEREAEVARLKVELEGRGI